MYSIPNRYPNVYSLQLLEMNTMYWHYLSVSSLLSKVHTYKAFFGLLSVVYSSTFKGPLLDFTRLRICLVSTSQWSTTYPTILKIGATSNCFLGYIFQFLWKNSAGGKIQMGKFGKEDTEETKSGFVQIIFKSKKLSFRLLLIHFHNR